jgi:hypothetical protein
MSHIILPGTSPEQQRQDQEIKPTLTPAERATQQKHMMLVGLAFVVVILGWVATWHWSYDTDSPGVGQFFSTLRNEAAPGVQQIGDTTDQIRNNE